MKRRKQVERMNVCRQKNVDISTNLSAEFFTRSTKTEKKKISFNCRDDILLTWLQRVSSSCGLRSSVNDVTSMVYPDQRFSTFIGFALPLRMGRTFTCLRMTIWGTLTTLFTLSLYGQPKITHSIITTMNEVTFNCSESKSFLKQLVWHWELESRMRYYNKTTINLVF